MKTFFTFLLYLIIVLLIGGIVFGVGFLLERPISESAVVFGIILGSWLLFILVKKMINTGCRSWYVTQTAIKKPAQELDKSR
jgi:ABC-type transport system involved in multi-copper enzyme maturation permease subunit